MAQNEEPNASEAQVLSNPSSEGPNETPHPEPHPDSQPRSEEVRTTSPPPPGQSGLF